VSWAEYEATFEGGPLHGETEILEGGVRVRFVVPTSIYINIDRAPGKHEDVDRVSEPYLGEHRYRWHSHTVVDRPEAPVGGLRYLVRYVYEGLWL
jgi:hypothetical protein